MRLCVRCDDELPAGRTIVYCRPCWAEYMRQYRATPRGSSRVVAATQAWRRRNPDKHQQLQRRQGQVRGEMVRVNGSEAYDRWAIYERDGGRCHLCAGRVAREDFHVDHLVPLSRGGRDAPDNVAVAHPRCNMTRGPGRTPAQLRLIG